MVHSLECNIHDVLRAPIGLESNPEFGFGTLEEDGSTKLGLSERVLAAMAREAFVRCIPGVVFNEITAHAGSASI